VENGEKSDPDPLPSPVHYADWAWQGIAWAPSPPKEG